jgi:hypothetical protein
VMASLAAQKKITNQLRPRWHRCISRHVLTLHYCSLLSSDVGALERLDVRCERYMHDLGENDENERDKNRNSRT